MVISVESIVKAYETTGLRPLLKQWFWRSPSQPSQSFACPLGVLLVVSKAVDAQGNNLLGARLFKCQNYLEAASKVLGMGVEEVHLFILGYDGERVAPELRINKWFRLGREVYGVLSRLGKIQGAK